MSSSSKANGTGEDAGTVADSASRPDSASASTGVTKATTNAAVNTSAGPEVENDEEQAHNKDSISGDRVRGAADVPSSADVPKSVRYDRLQQLSVRSLDQVVRALTMENTLSCYPSIGSTPQGKNELRQAIDQISLYWQTSATEEFDSIYSERSIKQKMIELDQLLEEARHRRDGQTDSTATTTTNTTTNTSVPPGSLPVHLDALNPDQITDAHLTAVKEAEIARLESQLAKCRAENRLLAETATAEAQSVVSDLESLAGALEKLSLAAQITDKVPSRQSIDAFIDSELPLTNYL